MARNIDELVSVTCPTCNRPGYVKCKDRALATEIDVGEHAFPWSEYRATKIPSTAIRAIVLGCRTIFESTREGVDVATAEGRPVVFDFNDRMVTCPPNGDANAIARSWWKDAYGETPEQTMARR